MTRLIYLGPPSSVSLRGVGDFQLSTGKPTTLPRECAYARKLKARGLLREEPGAPPPEQAAAPSPPQASASSSPNQESDKSRKGKASAKESSK